MAELADALDLGSSGQPCRFKSCYPHQKGKGGVHLLLFLFVKVAGLEVGAVVNDSPVDCHSRERPSRAVRGANQVLLPAPTTPVYA